MRQVLIIFPKALCGLEAIILPCKKKKKKCMPAIFNDDKT